MTNQNTDPAHRLLVNGVAAIIGVTLIVTAALIYFGNQPEQEYWARNDTINGAPSIEIYP